MCVCACGCVCPPLRLLITSGVIWTPYDWLNKGYSLYMAAVVIIDGGCGLRIEAHRSNQPTKTKLSLYSRYFHFNIPFKQLYTSCKTECFSYKGGCGVHRHTRIKVFKRRPGLGYR